MRLQRKLSVYDMIFVKIMYCCYKCLNHIDNENPRLKTRPWNTRPKKAALLQITRNLYYSTQHCTEFSSDLRTIVLLFSGVNNEEKSKFTVRSFSVHSDFNLRLNCSENVTQRPRSSKNSFPLLTPKIQQAP